MLNIPEEVKALFKQDGVRKNFRVHFPNGERADLVNKDIIEQSVKFTESTCSQQNLRFGLTELSTIEFECVGVENIAGVVIECGIEVDVSSLGGDWAEANGATSPDVPFSFYAVPYGVFVVDKCPRQADMTRRKVTGYSLYDEDKLDGLKGYRRGIPKVSLDTLLKQISAGPADFNSFRYQNLLEAPAVGANSATSLSSKRILTFSGVDFMELTDTNTSAISPIFTSFTRSQTLDINYEPSEFDSITAELYKIARAAMPSGTYTYYPGGNLASPYQVYPNMTVAPALALGCLLPHIAVSLYYSASQRLYPCYPIILGAPGRYTITPSELVRGNGAVGTPDGYVIYVRIPIRWRAAARWTVSGAATPTETPVTNWPITQEVERQGDVSAERLLNPTPVYDDHAKIKATSRAGVAFPGMGRYYDYNGAFPAKDAANGLLEARGQFGNFTRDGQIVVKALTRTPEEQLQKGLTKSAWYEEFVAGGYGAVRYTYLDGTDTCEGELVFDPNAPRVYDLTGNKLLELLTDRSQDAIETLLSQTFAVNAAGVNYVPIDVSAKGLPWVEDGDALAMETDEGVIESYVLRRTLSGVQHLTDDIEAEGVEA